MYSNCLVDIPKNTGKIPRNKRSKTTYIEYAHAREYLPPIANKTVRQNIMSCIVMLYRILSRTIIPCTVYILRKVATLFQHHNSIPKSSFKSANADEWSSAPVNGSKKAR